MKKYLCFVLAIILMVSVLAGATTALAEATPKPVTLTVFVDHTWFWIDSFGGRIVDDEITRRTGVTLDVIRAADASQLSILIASGSYPDIIYTGTTSMWPKLANPNVSYDWNTLIEKYAPDFPVKDIEIANATQPDGKFYTIYNAYSTPDEWKNEPRMLPSNGTSTLHVRKDIMESLGNPKLETLEDLENVLGMVHEKYPDMDGLLLGENLYGLPYFRYCFGVPTGNTRLWYDEAAGEVKYIVEAPEYKETLAYLNRLYRKGYIKPEALIYQVEQYRQKVNSGEAFAFVRSVTESDGANKAFKDAGMPYTAAPVERLLSEKPLYVNDSIGWSGVYITKNCKDPEAAIKMLSYLKSPEGQMLCEFGVEGKTYTIGEDGYPALTDEVLAVKAEGYTKMVEKYGLACWNFGVSAVTEALFNYTPKEQAILNTLLNVRSVIDFRPWFQFVLPAVGTDERDNYTKIGSYIDGEAFKLIASETEEEFNAAYAVMLDTCNSMGLPAFKAYVNAAYPAVIEKYKQ